MRKHVDTMEEPVKQGEKPSHPSHQSAGQLPGQRQGEGHVAQYFQPTNECNTSPTTASSVMPATLCRPATQPSKPRHAVRGGTLRITSCPIGGNMSAEGIQFGARAAMREWSCSVAVGALAGHHRHQWTYPCCRR